MHQGKQLSYNNYFDLESAIRIVLDFTEPSCSIIKHSNPCGFGTGDSLLSAYRYAVESDPISYFGGIVAFNNSLVFIYSDSAYIYQMDENLILTQIDSISFELGDFIDVSTSDNTLTILGKNKIISIDHNLDLAGTDSTFNK